ncbi:MAG: hypothetical protein ACI4WW_02650 [Candidatus Coprovivens sp.]
MKELQTYCEVVDALPLNDRQSLMRNWSKRRNDVIEEYFKGKKEKNLVEHFVTNILECEIDKNTTIIESLIMKAIENESDKIDFNGLIKLQKLTGGSIKKEVKGEINITNEVRELSK